MILDPIIPIPQVALLAALALALTLWVYTNVGGRLEWRRRVLLTICRVLGLALLLAILLQPSREVEIARPKIDRVTLVAVDTSRSMRQPDVDNASRLDAARAILTEAGLTTGGGIPSAVRLLQFGEDAEALDASAVTELRAEGSSTRFHRSIESMLDGLGSTETADALVLLTDGHDLEGVVPARTAHLARARHVPIFALPLGETGRTKDASVQIVNYQPYSYVNQKTLISANLRVIGCEYEDLTVQLIKGAQIVESRSLNAEERRDIPVDFEIAEPQTGQYEYEVQVAPLPGENDPGNNSALTFLNVIDEQVRVLLLEASPNWETAFLQRALVRNAKVDVDAVVLYAPGKSRLIRKNPDAGALTTPQTVEDFATYNIVILGQELDQLLDGQQIEALSKFVETQGGTVIFTRDRPFGDVATAMEPVIWSDGGSTNVRLEMGRDGRTAPPMALLAESEGGLEALPQLIAARQASERKPLASTLAEASDVETGDKMPGLIHRRYGRGQVLSLGIDGLWRLGFHAKVDPESKLFERFWDQMIVWLMARGDFSPGDIFAFRVSASNVPQGEPVSLRLFSRDAKQTVDQLPVTLFHGEKKVAELVMTPDQASDKTRLSGVFTPEQAGRYSASATLPNGKEETVKFLVYEENLEDKEVAADRAYLTSLCEASGGRLLTREEIGRLPELLDRPELNEKPKMKLVPIWDRVSIFYLAGLLFGTDWFLRRRWGLC